MVRVFGLERSGTNLMEWVVKTHFNPNYERIIVKGKYRDMRNYKKPQCLKHQMPTNEYEDKNIVIYKKFDKWRESWNAKYRKKGEWVLGGQIGCTKMVHKKYLKQAKKIGAYVVEYKDFIDNYHYHVRNIAEYLGVRLEKVIDRPTKTMGTNMKPCE